MRAGWYGDAGVSGDNCKFTKLTQSVYSCPKLCLIIDVRDGYCSRVNTACLPS